MTPRDKKVCEHPRARYVDLGPIGRHVCPDCHDIDWKGEWPRGERLPLLSDSTGGAA